MADDARRNAARYLVDKLAKERGEQSLTEAEQERDEQRSRTTAPTASDRAAYVETAIQQAMRRGDFDDLPGAGKPLTGLDGRHDPDWWIRRKIEREQLTGLGPPALTLRTEDKELDARLDALFREDDVRAVLEDFNTRVINAQRQLQGGPPVVTKVRDVERDVAAWRRRRIERRAAEDARRAAEEADREANTWWNRRRRRASRSGRLEEDSQS
jgi:hypothetical protein